MHTEKTMRDETVPTPETVDELAAYVRSLVDGQHDYGTCVYAMSMAATAAFNHVAKALGVTGFQASCADMDILRRTRRLEGPFMLIDGEKALYPQYDLPQKLAEFLVDIKPWLAKQAAKKLAEAPGAHPNVYAHWRQLAEQAEQEPPP